MREIHDIKEKRVSEPVQVYLDRGQRRRLEQLAGALGLTKSAVLRRGLEALEHQIADPAEHPAIRIIGIAAGTTTRGPGYDVALEHDRYLGESEQKSWNPTRRRKRGG